MTREERVRRLIDGELDAAQAAALLAEADRDPGLRALLDDAAQVQDAVALLRAEDVAPSPDLVDRVVRRAVAEREAEERRARGPLGWLRGLSRPRTIRVVPITVAGPLAAAAVVTITLLGSGIGDPGASVLPAAGPAPLQQPAGTPEPARGDAARPVPVRFVLPAGGARSVAVAGDFNDWRTDETLLDDADGDGIFVGMLRLPPGSYAYMFVIDGERWVTDPFAGTYRDDGFGHRNAVIRLD